MTSLNVIKDQIGIFLESDTPEIIAIKGKWGTGKTYAWNTYLNEAKKANKIKLANYSYVSLFGISSLEDLRFTIFQNSIDKSAIGSEVTPQTFQGFCKKALPFINDGAEFFKLNKLSGRVISALSVNKSIICIDDFERTNIDAQDILGLLSELKEQRSCKVVLILNDEELNQDMQEKYHLFKEKVIDKEFLFAPTAEDCATIVFNDGEVDINQGNAEILKEKSIKLNIGNIRIFKKILRFAKEVNPFLNGKRDETIDKTLSELALITHSLYCHNDNIPNIDFLSKNFSLRYKTYQSQNNTASEEDTKNAEKWEALLSQYEGTNFVATDTEEKLRSEVIESVQRGYFIGDKISKILNDCDHEYDIQDKNAKFFQAWDKYHLSLGDDEEELVEALCESVKNYAKEISLTNLSATCILLRDLGRDKEANDLINCVITSGRDVNDFNPNDYLFQQHVKDRELIKRAKNYYLEKQIHRPLYDICSDVGQGKGYSVNDLETLASQTVEEFCELFKENYTENIRQFIIGRHRLGLNQNTVDQATKTQKTIVEALKKIAGENTLNKLRVKQLGVDIDDT